MYDITYAHKYVLLYFSAFPIEGNGKVNPCVPDAFPQ